MNDERAIAAGLAREFEGCSLKPYLCPAGYWTVGWGNRALANGAAVTAHTPAITQAYADALLNSTIAALQIKLRQMVKVPLSAKQEGALLDFQYNLGTAALSGSTLLRLLNARQYSAAADQLLFWNHMHQNGRLVVSPGLTRRRHAEWLLFNGLSSPARPPAPAPSPTNSTETLNAASLARAKEIA